jgi:8-oxo-dGTP diphosphatase
VTDQLPVVSAILTNPRGEVLLQQRDNNPAIFCPGCWTLPGGMVEPDETPDEAIVRELWEEMEFRLPLTYWQVYEAQRGINDEITVIQHIYLGRLDRPAAEIPLHEGQQIRFFDQTGIAGLRMAFGFGEVLHRFFAAQPR